MGSAATVLKSRLARRFFMMFILCALLPILALTGFSYYRVIGQLKDQAFERLRQSSKIHALSIYEHLLAADQQLQLIQELQSSGFDGSFADLPPNIMTRTAGLFTGLARVRRQQILASWGRTLPSEYSETIGRMLSTQEPIRLAIWNNDEQDQYPEHRSVAIIQRTIGAGEEFLIGIIDPDYLWGLETGSILPAFTEVGIWDERGGPIYHSLPSERSGRAGDWMGTDTAARFGGQSELSVQERPFLVAYWSLFLKPQFAVSHWTVMVLEPKDKVLAPMHIYSMVFRLVLMLAVIIVVGLSIWSIHWSLTPIRALMEGAKQVANQQFSHRVIVHSNDEFSDLAAAFNHMTRDLDHQFRLLIARSDMDRTILSVSDIDQIASTGLKLSKTIYACETAAIAILDTGDGLHGRCFVCTETVSPLVLPFQLCAEEYEIVSNSPDWAKFNSGEALSFLSPLSREAGLCSYIFPIRLNGHLFAIVSMGFGLDITLNPAELVRIREFCNHLAVAFANANLVSELKALNQGALNALGRTVDAKSSWTAGHSVRVTQLALHIAGAMGLSPLEQERLHRAGLLHDIGKIGIPLSILDKSDKLTEEEYALIKKHPSIGARILSPLQPFEKIIPIIEQHHERYDGKGYPFGLCKEQIHFSARILSLADAFDAMTSDRPYRKGLGIEKTMQIIQAEAGHQFDPQVVAEWIRIGPPAISLASDDMAVLPGGNTLSTSDAADSLIRAAATNSRVGGAAYDQKGDPNEADRRQSS